MVCSKLHHDACKRQSARLGNPNNGGGAGRAGAATTAETRRFAENVLSVIKQIQDCGVTSLRGVAAVLNACGVQTTKTDGRLGQSCPVMARHRHLS